MSQFSSQSATLIYSHRAGSPRDSVARLERVRALLRDADLQPEVVLTHTAAEVTAAAATAVRNGADLVITCGGDGTIESAANALVNTTVPLGILPAGTRNNIARSLGIPLNLAKAVTLLRSGEERAISAGLARCGGQERWFLETFTVGLFSALFPHADAIQKGDLRRVGDLFMTFINAPTAKIHLSIDDGAETIEASAQAVLGVNMPLIAANWQMAGGITLDDEHLDIFIYDRLDKFDFLAYGFDVVTGIPEDPDIRRVRAHTVTVHTEPALTVMADGFPLGEGAVDVRLAPASLRVITPSAPPLPAP